MEQTRANPQRECPEHGCLNRGQRTSPVAPHDGAPGRDPTPAITDSDTIRSYEPTSDVFLAASPHGSRLFENRFLGPPALRCYATYAGGDSEVGSSSYTQQTRTVLGTCSLWQHVVLPGGSLWTRRHPHYCVKNVRTSDEKHPILGGGPTSDDEKHPILGGGPGKRPASRSSTVSVGGRPKQWMTCSQDASRMAQIL